MSTESEKLEQTKYLCYLYEQIKSAKTVTGACYLACAMGMWAQIYGVSNKKNPFLEREQSDLVLKLASWWTCGWQASRVSPRIYQQKI